VAAVVVAEQVLLLDGQHDLVVDELGNPALEVLPVE
jgi:hypothetical protein